MEFTFVRDDAMVSNRDGKVPDGAKDDTEQRQRYHTAFPHVLDGDNTAFDELVLPRCWYRHDDSQAFDDTRDF